MRYVVYLVAVLVAACLVYAISQPPRSTEPEVATPTATTPADAQLVTLKVPDMHCPVACYPAVKKTLEQQPGVLAVDLAEQQEEGIIDNPEVLIQTGEGFQPQAAIDSLTQAGFEQSSVTP